MPPLRSAASPSQETQPLPQLPLSDGVSSRLIRTQDLTFHILEAGATPSHDRPLIVLLHGFPEIAYSWRRVLPRLAAAGFYAVAPDQRGFGRTTGWDSHEYHDVNLMSFSMTNLVRDVIVLVHALGYRSVQCVVGHDCGAMSASMCALSRPDFFRSVVLMSHPFNGSPTLPFNTADRESDDGRNASRETAPDIHAALAERGRKHYQWYYSTPEANRDMSCLPRDHMHHFLRGYFHLKSASWSRNDPVPLKSWTAEELIKMPGYYIMPLDCTMPETVDRDMVDEPTQGTSSHSWLPDEELAVYVDEYIRTGFRGGLNWYRVRTAPEGRYMRDCDIFAGKKIECPCAFISGKQDWGIYQVPGALEKMTRGEVCSAFRILRLLDGVGHWVPQEAPDAVVQTIIDLVEELR
ncbi:Epoxide hydrolase [Penicillium ucsense]|uniref:Epoxide hydrolase n=1 Tax=Penicillium ucsense TaxID=2839758 RepID=A0A8J8WJA6_9EURO|nr:Epoxide hydrolase [Penicillium ucsense]KAF7736077.1 Epoxide hydrolase [Penicillium ucsense]